MLLDFLQPHMNVNNDEAFSVYPGKTLNPGDIIKGRTCRRLDVTRKIIIGDIPALIKAALDMQTFCLVQNVFDNCRVALWAATSRSKSAQKNFWW